MHHVGHTKEAKTEGVDVVLTSVASESFSSWMVPANGAQHSRGSKPPLLVRSVGLIPAQTRRSLQATGAARTVVLTLVEEERQEEQRELVGQTHARQLSSCSPMEGVDIVLTARERTRLARPVGVRSAGPERDSVMMERVLPAQDIQRKCQ